MFFLGAGVALGFQGAKSGDDPGTGGGRLDHGVDVAALCGHEGIGEALAKLSATPTPRKSTATSPYDG